MFSLTHKALEDFDNQHDFERMCAAILNVQGYLDVVLMAPRGGSDGGRDITFTTPLGENGLACITLRKDINKKFGEDFSQRRIGEYKKYILFCNVYLTVQQKDSFTSYCNDNLKTLFIPQDIESLRAILDGNETYKGIKTEYLKLPSFYTIEKEREDLSNILNLFNRAVFFAPFSDEDPFEMLYSLRKTRISLQISKAAMLRNSEIASHFQEAQNILMNIESQVNSKYPAIARAIPRQPDQQIDHKLCQKAQRSLGQNYGSAVKLMMGIRSDIDQKLESARRRLNEIDNLLKYQ